MTQPEAQSACQRRNSFLPRITNSNIQSKLADFRSAASNLLGEDRFWIDVKVVGINDWHWIDGSSFAGLCTLSTRIHWYQNGVNNNKGACSAVSISDFSIHSFFNAVDYLFTEFLRWNC